MVKEDSNTASGFTLYRSNYQVRLLLPFATAAEIEAEAERAELVSAAETAAAAAAQKAKPVPVFPPTKAIAPGPMDVEIFSESTIETFLDNAEAMDSATRRAAEKVYSSLTKDRGRYRTVPNINPSDVLALTAQFENMAEPIKYLAGEIALMAHLPPDEFHISPMLLLGEPGIGKTAFASALSKVLGLPYSKIRGSEPSFCLTGSHSSWTKAAPGMLINQMAFQDSAAPLFLVDEVDKQSGEQYPITTALLDLLEPENARNFKDEFFQVHFDTSHAVWILTANTTAGVDPALLSRMTVFDIPTPSIEQRKRIVETDLNKLCTRTGVRVNINPDNVMMLAERTDLDLRKVTRIVRDGFITALGHEKRIAHFDFPPAAKSSMGFM